MIKKETVSLSSCCLKAGGGGGETEPHSSAAAPTPEEELLNRAVVVLSCASYRNQVLHIFLRPALLASAVHAASSTKKRETDSDIRLFFTCTIS